MVAKRLARHADVIVDVDAGTVERRTPLARAAAAAAASGTVAAVLKTHAAAPLYSISYKGGDAWTRRCVEDALHAALADAAPPPKTSLLSRLRGSTTTWGDLARAAPHFQRWRRRAHAAAEEPAAEAPVFTETYEGERDEFGRRRGRGRCVAPDYTYDGEWAEDAAHGRGALTTSTFSYEGTFRDGAFHGRGRWRKADGSRSYEGEFESGEFHGAGKLERRADGDDAGAWTSYVGEWSRGKRHGTGTCVYADGSTYSGEWRDGEAHGEGVRTRDGAVYRGQFVRGLRHGAGVLTTGEGDVYDGVFCDDAMAPDAAFTVTYADGRRYGGRVKDGVPSGSHGMMKYADGSFYEGDFADGLRSGKGTLFEGPDLAPRTGDWRCDVLVQLRSVAASFRDFDHLVSDFDLGVRRRGDRLIHSSTTQAAVRQRQLHRAVALELAQPRRRRRRVRVRVVRGGRARGDAADAATAPRVGHLRRARGRVRGPRALAAAGPRGLAAAAARRCARPLPERRRL